MMSRAVSYKAFLLVFLITFLCGCNMTNSNTPAPATATSTSTPQPPEFRVIAYVTDAVTPAQIQYDKLTHINFAFLLPNEDGTFQKLTNPWKVEEIVRRAHEQNVKVLISVGGWGWDVQFENMAANPGTRIAFVQNLVNVVNEYKLDGADIDWEYPNPGQSAQNFLALVQELRTALPEDKLLTAAVVAYGDEHGLGIPSESFALMDFINIMTYDGPDHGTMQQFEHGLTYWLGRGLPPEKLTMGVPFYSRPSETPYWKIVKADPAAAQTDTFDYFGALNTYNGIPTMKAKTQMAMERASGIMFWTLESDATGDLSLLNAIHQVVVGGE
jgi:GH18 family chitinase